MGNVIQKRIQIAISQKHTSAKKMLEETGLNPGFITDIERKGAFPAADKLMRIADYLDVSVDYLLGRTGDPTPLGRVAGSKGASGDLSAFDRHEFEGLGEGEVSKLAEYALFLKSQRK